MKMIDNEQARKFDMLKDVFEEQLEERREELKEEK